MLIAHIYTNLGDSCGRECDLFNDENKSDFDFSGLPCPDMSSAGLRLAEEGATAPVFITHAKYHIDKGTKLLIIENVTDSGC